MSIRADLLHYFESNPNKNIFLKDLEKEFPDLEKKQIQTGVYQLINHSNPPVAGFTVIQNGQIWKYNPDDGQAIGDTVINILQETPKGSIIFQMNESIWIAKKVED